MKLIGDRLLTLVQSDGLLEIPWGRTGGPGQRTGRWNQAGDAPVHYLANSPLVAWAEWLRHQEIDDPADLDGVAAALWAVVIPDAWGEEQLPELKLPIDVVLAIDDQGMQRRRQALVTHKANGAMGLRAPSAAMQDPCTHPCRRCDDGTERAGAIPAAPMLLVLWCGSELLVGWACVEEGRPSVELLRLVRRQGLLR